MQSYHDNLILKFDDDITGNAASNQLVTVFNAGTDVKPLLFDVFGSPIANPVTTDSKGNYSFSIADGTYDIVARQGTPDETRRDEFIISEPSSFNAAKSFDTLDDAIADTGLVDGDAFTVENFGDYKVQVGQSDVTLNNGLFAKHIGSRTHINPSINKLSSDIQSLTQSYDTVITGDSLSFNGVGYPAGWNVNSGGYATDQPFGMMSWAHMLRDLWLSSQPSFESIQHSDWHTDCVAGPVFPTGTQLEHFGMNVKALSFVFADDVETVIVESKYSGTNSLIVSYALTANAVTFEVDGAPFDNESPDGDYRSRGYLLIPCGTNPTITNVKNKVTPATLGGVLDVYGTVGVGTKIPKLTGKGGYTSAQILAEYSTLVAPFTPDVVYYIVGANDEDSGVPIATFKANVQQFITNVRADSSNATIILMSIPPSTNATDEESAPYVHTLLELAIENSCSCIDMISELNQIQSSIYLFDNIHWTKKGDDIVFNIVKKLSLPALSFDLDRFAPSRDSFLGASLNAMSRKAQTYSLIVQMTTTTATVFDSSNSNFSDLVDFEYAGAGVNSQCNITLPFGFEVAGTSPLRTGADPTDIVDFKSVLNDRQFSNIKFTGSTREEIDGSDAFLLITANRTEDTL